MCECGTVKEIPYTYLKNGNIKSCGCLVKDINGKKTRERNTKHNKAKTRLYNTWRNIRQRCNNPNAIGYKNYGGRGISITPEWDNFTSFEDWSLKNGYSDNLTIDRIDNDGNYEPDNCQWITKGENSTKRNKDPKNRGFKKSRYSEDDIRNIQRLRAKGHTYKYLADLYKCSISHIKRICDGEIQYTG